MRKVLFFSLFVLSSCTAFSFSETVHVVWNATLHQNSKGFGVIFDKNSGKDSTVVWDEPNLPGVLAMGFDAQNPKTENIFNADGNIYGRRETEISIHWNGREIANKFCKVDFRRLSGCHYDANLCFVTGGLELTLSVDGIRVFDKFFVPGIMPFEVNPVAGGDVKVSQFGLTRSKASANWKAPKTVVVFDKVINNASHHRQFAIVKLPEDLQSTGRVVFTLSLSETPAGLDPWDRIAAIYLYDERGERFELVRYITPYKKGWEWSIDVTDFFPLLTGQKKFEMWCETWGAGWLVSGKLDFYEGKRDRTPIKVINLWSRTAEIGFVGNPVTDQIKPIDLKLNENIDSAKVRLCVTGHGQSPNSNNAAEFLPLWRKVRINEREFVNTLWKDDCYLNPCRPQGGTWKFDRAGWAPGDVVSPWEIEIAGIDLKSRNLRVTYQIQPYENKTRDAGNPARHVIESQLILYKK